MHERSKADLFFFFLNLPHPTLLTVLRWPCVVDRILKSCYCLTTLHYLPQLTLLLLSSTLHFTAIFHSPLFCYLPQPTLLLSFTAYSAVYLPKPTLLLSSTEHYTVIFHSPLCCYLPQHTLLFIFQSPLRCYLPQNTLLLSSTAHSVAIFHSTLY